ncbi:MAG: CBM9 family sugar-binding protein, partial [Sedimentisphaerales bacterium]|nr:CBM9 family sugar-binding protein [Sedimentisphaerales bacterium]
MNKNFLILALSVLVLSTTALGYEGQDVFGEYYITVGEPTIDGEISEGEWDDAKWLPLDLCYSDMQGVPCPDDLFDASWAALWSPATNRIYVVVTGRDTDNVFGDCYCGGEDYNKYDLVEVYVDAANHDTSPYQQIWNDEGDEIGADYAQQWMTGYDGNEGWWCVPPQWPDYNDDNPLAAEYIPEMAVKLVGDILTYEYALTPYESFGWLSGRETKELQLEADLQVGLDIVIGSRDGSFGTLCENAYDGSEEGPDGEIGTADDWIASMGKWDDASMFLDHWLVLDVNQAWRPRPANKAVDVPGNVTLQWNPGRNATHHDVYFGTSYEDVNIATDPNLAPVGRGRQALGNTTYTPDESPLNLNTTYYWRIDEVSSAPPGQSWKGNVWRFTTGDYIVVEDFDSYDKDNPLVYDEGDDTGMWIDGWTNETGSGLDLETIIVRDGQSMAFSYQNADYLCSEAKADIADLGVYSNWYASGVKAVSLWFYGEPDNSATVNDRMYVALEDTGGHLAVVPYDGDAN